MRGDEDEEGDAGSGSSSLSSSDTKLEKKPSLYSVLHRTKINLLFGHWPKIFNNDLAGSLSPPGGEGCVSAIKPSGCRDQ